MTARQRIELRRSQIRSRLGDIAGLEGDSLTDAIVAERDGLMAELQTSEPQLRAAIEAEGTETRAAGNAGDGEHVELRRLESQASVGAIFGATIEHRSTDGATAELQQHLGLSANQIPLALLRSQAEEEHRAATTSPTNVGANQAAIIGAVFPRAAASWLSVDMPRVMVGDAVYPVLTTGATAGTPAKGAPQAESDGVFAAELLSPGRIQASFFYAREDAARFMGMDQALRMNLADTLSDKLDAEIISGPSGLLGGTNLTKVASSMETSWDGYRNGLVYSRVDGTWAWGADDLRVLIGTETLAHMSSVYRGDETERPLVEDLTAVSGGLRVSAHIPAATSNKQDALVRRGMRRDMVAPVWEGVTLIPDEVTKASTGQIVLTAVMLYAVKILRTGGFARIETQHA